MLNKKKIIVKGSIGMSPLEEKKSGSNCFIITPIGADKSEIRRNADGVIISVIRPLLEDFNYYNIKAAHEINASGSINNQIMIRIIEDDLVIANLTGVNPNVMYEVAVRHATQKPIIHICEEGTRLPFDIIDQRTIFYKNDMLGVQELRQNLKKAIEEIIDLKEFTDNPIYNAVKTKIYQDTILKDPEKSFEKYLLERFNRLESKLIGTMANNEKQRAYKNIESFEIELTVDQSFDKENFFIELDRILNKEGFGINSFRIMKEESDDYGRKIFIFAKVGSNRYIPTTSEVSGAITGLKFSKILNQKVEGNELPF